MKSTTQQKILYDIDFLLTLLALFLIVMAYLLLLISFQPLLMC